MFLLAHPRDGSGLLCPVGRWVEPDLMTSGRLAVKLKSEDPEFLDDLSIAKA
jgi:hypothetical protein